jgi:putative MATE family efflux protein
MVLDPLLIFQASLGIAGAAVATVLGQLLAAAFLLFWIKFGKNRPFEHLRIIRTPDLKAVLQIIKWALPMCLESFLFTSAAMITSRREASFGADAMAVSRVGSQIESITWLVGGSFGLALTSFTGQNYGAGKWDRIHKTFKISSVVMAIYGLGVSALLIFGGKRLFSLFLPDADLVRMSGGYLSIIAICQIPSCLEAVASNMFRGLGRTVPPSIVNTASNILRVPLSYLLSATPLGLYGVWAGITIAASVKGIWSYPWFSFARKRIQSRSPFGALDDPSADPKPLTQAQAP